MKQILFESISQNELKKRLKELYNYLKKNLEKMDRDPKVFFHEDAKNADDFLGKTGYYSPKSEEIHLYITDRHAKDILRSFAHEVIHHEQNCSGMTGKLDMSATKDPDYASKNKGLRKAEKDAFTRGNMLFRDWTDSLKAEREQETRIMAEKKNNKLDGENSYEKKRSAAIEKAIASKKDKKKLKKEEKGCKSKKYEVQNAKKKARSDAKRHVKHQQGKDIKEMNDAESVEKLEESFIYNPLLEPRERVLKETFNKREDLVFQQLLEKFGIKKDA